MTWESAEEESQFFVFGCNFFRCFMQTRQKKCFCFWKTNHAKTPLHTCPVLLRTLCVGKHVPPRARDREIDICTFNQRRGRHAVWYIYICCTCAKLKVLSCGIQLGSLRGSSFPPDPSGESVMLPDLRGFACADSHLPGKQNVSL